MMLRDAQKLPLVSLRSSSLAESPSPASWRRHHELSTTPPSPQVPLEVMHPRLGPRGRDLETLPLAPMDCPDPPSSLPHRSSYWSLPRFGRQCRPRHNAPQPDGSHLKMLPFPRQKVHVPHLVGYLGPPLSPPPLLHLALCSLPRFSLEAPSLEKEFLPSRMVYQMCFVFVLPAQVCRVMCSSLPSLCKQGFALSLLDRISSGLVCVRPL